ncbi:MAG: trypsin, partial [Eubacterium sp.]|nr:trypsin [Eubacterium sp.]
MKKRKKWLCILLTLLVFTVSSPTVYAQTKNSKDETEETDKLLAPYFVIQNPDSATDRFPLKDTTVTTNINGVIAETYVTQTYANEGQNPINASYVFPASSNVTVHGMKMEIGNNVVTAQIKEKEEAKQEFEEAKSEGKSASLLEQQRPNVFTMDVANIMPGDTARIELHYTELINPTDGIYEFIFPTVVGPRFASPSESGNSGADAWVETPYLPEGETPPGTYNITVNLSTGVPITELGCKSHEINISKSSDSAAKVTLANPSDYAGNRDFILKYKLTGDEVQSGLVLTKGETENYFMLSIQPPERFETDDIPPREYIFVLDVSGSM